VYIVDVEGAPFGVALLRTRDATAADLAEVDKIVASLRLTP
jgi:hypothetical protein